MLDVAKPAIPFDTKRLDRLMDDAGIDACLVVVGFGPERTALEARAADRGVDTLFTGPLEHRHLRRL